MPLCRFKLSHPSEPGEVQDMLGIKEEASFVLSAKVRTASSTICTNCWVQLLRPAETSVLSEGHNSCSRANGRLLA